MEGPQMVKAWKDWLHSEAGKKCADPHTLPKTGMYLENRLQSAFYAGVRAEQAQSNKQGSSSNLRNGG